MKVEKALLLSPIQLKKLLKLPSNLNMIYVGSDCCEHLIPSIEDVRLLLETKCAPVILVPILTDRFLSVLCALIDAVLQFRNEIEVSVNDIGSVIELRRLFERKVKLSIGRHLFSLLAKNSLEYIENFTREYNIHLLETDDAYTAESFLMSKKFRVAFHYPYKIYSVTRICPYCKTIPTECAQQCEDKYIPLDSGKIVWRGNSFFTRSNDRPKLTPQRLLFSYDVISHLKK